MAIDKKTIRLLILEDSQNEAERLVSLFRNAGHATRVHRLTSSDDLAETLQQTWDLLICAASSEQLDPSEAISAIRRQAPSADRSAHGLILRLGYRPPLDFGLMLGFLRRRMIPGIEQIDGFRVHRTVGYVFRIGLLVFGLQGEGEVTDGGAVGHGVRP